MKKIVFASSNKGKIKEVSEILNPLGIEVIPQTKFNIPDAKETGLSFVENAILKARHCSYYTKLPTLADDSGLCVDALNGAPGIYSARYAQHGNDKANIDKLLKEMQHIPDEKRKAHFQCVLVLVMHEYDPMPIIAEGRVDGFITCTPKGNNGFGYNPIFLLPAYHQTMAEVDNHIKNSISHRACALEKLKFKLIEIC
ncbi:RdgB/HAM1 family non-canonical purine NTP pyrophosphatase [Fastidiosibacter lacustris]|uniref:RdgB/HAM1 family non-canonical purine NTP pyrophosphatase n=1 Tax=Fastidiosibacter lacustris TaxID=2056695 RepID=UPI000E34B24F|nr:RdgB/HAM1 family non-canonical purine NTP pyrophosphatase [Fastidiosibacter lacustris]